MTTRTESCDVLVVGTGAGGFTAAIAAKKAGMKVLLIEKDELFGGTTAFSGGMIWIPGNRHSVGANAKSGKSDSIDTARRYILDEGRGLEDPANVEAYLKYGSEMVDYMERETEVKFYSMDYPDYVSENAASRTQRGLCTVNYQTSKMGEHLKTLRNQLPQTLFLGLAIGSSVEMKEFMRAGRSIKSLGFVVKKLIAHARDMVLYGRSEQMVRGRALIGRLARTAFDLGIPVWLSSPMKELIVEGCLAPLVQGPFYAVRLFAAEIGTFAGIKTDANARVMDKRNQPIAGLYAVGNDQASVFAGAYPGPGSTLGPAMTFGYIAGRHAAGVHAPETSSAQAKNVAPAAALV